MKILLLSVLAVIIIGVMIPHVNAEQVPDWVKNTAGWWATDTITEREFVNAIEFLIKNSIIQVATSSTTPSSEQVPDWVKNTAGWWATDAISENEFINAIEFLIQIRVINLDEKCIFNEIQYLHLNEFIKKILCDSNYSDEFFEGVVEKKDVSYEINSHSFRGDEFNSIKPENTFRIFLIGGSTIQGWGVEKEETISYLMQNNLNSLGYTKHFEVINAGMGGAWSKDEVDLVKNKIFDLEPDIIIIYDGWNDSLKQSGFHLGFDSKATPESWKNRWEEICSISNQYDTQIIITIQPILGSDMNRVLTDHENALLTSEGSSGHNQVISNLKKHVTEISNFNSCVNVYDLTKLFSDVQIPIFIDTGHVGVDGNKMISDEFIRLSEPRIYEKTNERVENNPKITFNKQNDKSINNKNLGNYLEDYDFTEKIFEKMVFKGTHFINNNFKNSKILDSNFRFTVIDNGKFTETNIDNSKFARSIFYKSSFSLTSLLNSNFSGAQFNQVEIKDSSLSNINLKGSVWDKSLVSSVNISKTDASKSFLRDVEFKKSKLFSVNFQKATIIDTIFNNTELDDINLKYTILAGTLFRNIDLTNVEFSHAEFSPKVFPGTLYKGTIIEKSILKNLDLKSVIFNSEGKTIFVNNEKMVKDKAQASKIIESDLTNSDLSNLNLNFINFFKSTLTGADLSNVSLRFANLEGVNLEGANLEGANLEGANLEGANLEGANLEGANLEGANLNCINHVICN